MAEDAALVQLARARPTKPEDLAPFRGLGHRGRDYRAAKIIAALHKVSFQGPTSQISFAKDGQLKISDYVPMVIKNGQFVVRSSSN